MFEQGMEEVQKAVEKRKNSLKNDITSQNTVTSVTKSIANSQKVYYNKKYWCSLHLAQHQCPTLKQATILEGSINDQT